MKSSSSQTNSLQSTVDNDLKTTCLHLPSEVEQDLLVELLQMGYTPVEALQIANELDAAIASCQREPELECQVSLMNIIKRHVEILLPPRQQHLQLALEAALSRAQSFESSRTHLENNNDVDDMNSNKDVNPDEKIA